MPERTRLRREAEDAIRDVVVPAYRRFQAFFNDPSIHLPLDDAWELFTKMLEVNKEYLPSMAVA